MNRMFSISLANTGRCCLAATQVGAQVRDPSLRLISRRCSNNRPNNCNQHNRSKRGAIATRAARNVAGWAARMSAMQDFFIASWIGADNQAEISLNQFASQKASNQDVKNFARD